MSSVYRSAEIEPDYVAVVDADTFAPPTAGTRRWRAVTAARIGTTRLIDNLFLGADR